MKIMKIFYLIIVLMILSSSAFAEITGKVVVRGKWGGGDNEFGLDLSEPPGAGPSDFAVAPNGDIYIADFVNHRIVIYDHDGHFIRNLKREHWIISLKVDSDGYIYYTDGHGLKIANNEGEIVSTFGKTGRIHLDQNNIYLVKDNTSFKLQLDRETNELRCLQEIGATLNGCFAISNGIEFRRAPDSLLKQTGIAQINVNGKPTFVKQIIDGQESIIEIDINNPFGNLSNGTILGGDGEGNIFIATFVHKIFEVNSLGLITSIFELTSSDDLHIIYGLPYVASGHVHVRDDKIYYMGATDEEFMIIEYEFQPVGNTVDVENEEDGVKKNIKE
jgi:hypothetical protein